MTGVYDVTSGDIVFKGESIAKLKTFQVISRGIARTFQNLRLFAASSVLENVMTAAQQHYKYNFFEAVTHLGRWKRREAATRKESMELLERVGLADRANQAAGTLPTVSSAALKSRAPYRCSRSSCFSTSRPPV